MYMLLTERNKVLEMAHWHGNYTVRSYTHLKSLLKMVSDKIQSLEKRQDRMPSLSYKKERKRLGNILLAISAKIRVRKVLLRETNLFY